MSDQLALVFTLLFEEYLDRKLHHFGVEES
jgi:hypothetical protein